MYGAKASWAYGSSGSEKDMAWLLGG
jgi:hypothetical protein